nr:DotI/IcmL family type IV secretion protein [Rickettsiella massiliensis]
MQAVISKKLIVSAVATGVPVVLEQGLLAGRYTWKVQIPMLVTFQSASQFSQQSVTVTMLIVRVSPLESPAAIGIAQFIVSGGGGITD